MQFAKKLIGNEEERAVSPVIGVILMVAITVILAAVIAAFVLDLGQSQSANANAGVSIDNNSGTMTVQLTDSGNADYVYLRGIDSSTTMGGGTVSCTDVASGPGAGNCELSDVGDSVDFPSSNNPVAIVAVSGDNENVIGNAGE